MSGGRRLAAEFAALVCGAATLVFAVALARQAPVLVLAVLVAAAVAGVVAARRVPERRSEPVTGFAPGGADDEKPRPAALPPAAFGGPRTSIPLAPVGASLEPAREPSESFLRLAHLVRESAPPAGLIQVTSPMAGEGKTTVATNLATALAALGDRVLLVDAHPDRLRAHLMLGTAPKFVSNGRPLREYIVPTPFANLDLFCAGNSETYGRITLAAIWRDLANRYDLTLIDTAGGLARALAGPVERADLNILVARADHTPARLIDIAAGRLEPDPTIVVMNAASGTPSRTPRPAPQQSGA